MVDHILWTMTSIREDLAARVDEHSAALRELRRPVRDDTDSRSTAPLVLAPSWLLACDDEGGLSLLRDHEVVVVGDTIEAVRPQRGSVDRRVDLAGQLLLP